MYAALEEPPPSARRSGQTCFQTHPCYPCEDYAVLSLAESRDRIMKSSDEMLLNTLQPGRTGVTKGEDGAAVCD